MSGSYDEQQYNNQGGYDQNGYGQYQQQTQSLQAYHQENAQYDPQSQTYQAQSYTAYDQTPSPYATDPNNPGPEGERGLLGGLAGAVAGGATGNKLCHGKGFLGALGGGVVGSIVEDVLKKKKSKQDVCHVSRPCTPQPTQVCTPPPPPQVCHLPQPTQGCYPPPQHSQPLQYQGQHQHGGGFVVGAAGGHSNGYSYSPAPAYK